MATPIMDKIERELISKGIIKRKARTLDIDSIKGCKNVRSTRGRGFKNV